MDVQEQQMMEARYAQAEEALRRRVATSGLTPATEAALRVGLDAAMSDHAALVKLLQDKGLITQDEYLTAVVVSLEGLARRVLPLHEVMPPPVLPARKRTLLQRLGIGR